MIQLWMYASCIFYPRSIVPDNLQWIMTLNPIVPIIESFRFALMGQGQVEIYQWLASLAITFVLLLIAPRRIRTRRKDVCRYRMIFVIGSADAAAISHPRLNFSHR